MNWEELISNISTGSIYELKTKYKDYKSKNIGLDFYGFDAVLPLKEIANEFELRFTLFNSIKKGELITLVLIEIDEVQRKLIFSTRVFRNSLDDILTFTRCKFIVENNSNTHLKIDSKFLKQNRNILDRLRGDLSSNELTFLYELIQNAVDHANKNFNNNVSVNFEVLENYLLVKHNGALFTENNFESITGILYGEQIQEGEKSRIGYKGIGFKSVFRFTDNAYVRSGNFSFRFSKEESGSDKPWEVLPIFQIEKEMVGRIPQFDFFNAPVAFAFEFNSKKNRNDVIKYLNQLSQNPYLLIFLDNLTQLKIKAPSASYMDNGVNHSLPPLDVNFVKEIANDEAFDSIKLFINNSSHSEWLIHTKKDLVITDEEVINELLDESVTAVPAKMRNFRTPRITIALPKYSLDGDIINLFTYLPLSNTKFKLPFLVNADFIPDLDRTDIIHNLKYNSEVLKLVALTLEEFSQKLAKNNRLDYLNTLMPDLSFDYQSSATIIVNRLLEFLPQTTLTYNGQQLPFSNIIIDKSGFVSSFGQDIFKKLIDQENVPVNILADHNKIVKLIERINPNSVFDITKLRERVKSDDFTLWLKVTINNLNFIKYLISKSYLDIFKDKSIFLAEDGELYKANEVFSNLGSDSDSLGWLSFKKVLHHSVSLGLTDSQLPLKQYEPISFINDVIYKDQKQRIIEGLNNGSISSYEFYSYISKYAVSPIFPVKEIKEFPIHTNQGTLPNWSKPIYFGSNSLFTLLSNKSLPANTIYLLDDNWSSTPESGFKLLAEKLGVNSFSEAEPYNFIKSIIVANKEQISNFYLLENNIEINANAALWSFILASFENLSPVQIETFTPILKSLPVLSKSKEFKKLNSLYLSSEYTDNDALEKLCVQFSNADIGFVSAAYLQFPSVDKIKIKKLFKLLDAKDETIDFLQHTLLPNLNQIADELFVPLTRLIYENRESEQIIKAVLSNTNFKVKTKEGKFKTIKECFLGAPYIEESQIPNPLDFVPVINQISTEYSDSYLDAWRKFFLEKLHLTQLLSEPVILNLKLKYISENIDSWKDNEKSVSLFNELYSLFKSGKLSLSGSNLSYIKNIPLLCKGNEVRFALSSMFHFSSAYKPTFDFEEIFGSDCGVSFLSEVYKVENDKQLVSFFELIGVTQYFDGNRHKALLQNIPTSDGQKKLASQLFKYEFKKVVGSDNVPFKNLSGIAYNGKTLEDYLGLISKLNVSSIINYITTSQPDRRELKELIAEFFKVYNSNNYNDRNLLGAFNSSEKLLSTAKMYNSVTSLYSIDESIRSGIRENEYLIDPLFNKQEQENRKRYFTLFNIKTLGIDDFNPHFEGEHLDYEFTNRVKERLVFLAFDSDSEKYLEVEKEFKEKFQEWKIKKCSKISLKYPASESKIIKEDNRNFILPNGKMIYFIGNWIEQRNYILVEWLKHPILNIQKQLQFVQDILLNNPVDIISEFENKGRIVPEEIKKRFRIAQPIEQPPTNTLSEPVENTTEVPKEEVSANPFKDISQADEVFIRSIIKGDFELNEKLDANTTAKIKTLMKIRNEYILSEISDEGRFLKAGSDEILVRSAQNGLLYLDIYHWGRLSEANVRLAVYTKSQIEIYNTQEELIQFTKPQNNFGIVRMPIEYSTEDYNSLDSITDKGKWHFVFIVNENTKAAKNYKEVMNLDDYNF